jgi:hypothetical protein
MEEIIQGNIFDPGVFLVPTMQAPSSLRDPSVYVKGQTISFTVSFPIGTKRLLFTLSNRIFDGREILKQSADPDPRVPGVSEFVVGWDITSKLNVGMYYWDIFQLASDGTKEIWLPYNKGTFSIIDSPSSMSIELDTTNIVDATKNIDLTIQKGSTWTQSIRWLTSGVVVDITGFTGRMKIKKSYYSTSSEIELTTENNRMLLGGGLGTIEIGLTATETEQLIPGKYVYDLELINGSSVINLMSGRITVLDEVTT